MQDKKWRADLAFETTTRRNGTRHAQAHTSHHAILRLSPPGVQPPPPVCQDGSTSEAVVKETRPIQRLVKTLDALPGVLAVHVEGDGNAFLGPSVLVSYEHTFSRYHGDGTPENLATRTDAPSNAEEAIEAVAQQWRNGELQVPAVSLEVHRAMAEQGVALRNDGLFGYKLRCRRAECVNRVEGKCFAVLDPVHAVEEAKTKRCEWVCGIECGLLEDGPDVWWPDIWDDMAVGIGNSDDPKVDGRSLLLKVCEVLGLTVTTGPLPDDVDDRFPDGKPDSMEALRQKSPSIYAEFAAWFRENYDNDGDPGDPEENEASCEV